MKTIKEKYLEKNLENECLDFAREQGFTCWKNESNGNVGIPDISLLFSEKIYLIELKRKDFGRLSVYQKFWMDKFPSIVFIINDLDNFKRLVLDIKSREKCNISRSKIQ